MDALNLRSTAHIDGVMMGFPELENIPVMVLSRNGRYFWPSDLRSLYGWVFDKSNLPRAVEVVFLLIFLHPVHELDDSP